MSIEKEVTLPLEERLTRADWEKFNKEIENCKDCKKLSDKQPKDPNKDYCAYHQEIYMDMTGSVI